MGEVVPFLIGGQLTASAFVLPKAMETGRSEELADSPRSIATASDLLAAEVAYLSTSLGERAGWSAQLAAVHAAVGARAATNAHVSVERVALRTKGFLDASEALRIELETLRSLESAVQGVLAAVGKLEEKSNQMLQEQQRLRREHR
jgi:hypothetical protein